MKTEKHPTEYRDLLRANDFQTTIGANGLVFVTPINKGMVFKKSFVSYFEAYQHYKEMNLL